MFLFVGVVCVLVVSFVFWLLVSCFVLFFWCWCFVFYFYLCCVILVFYLCFIFVSYFWWLFRKSLAGDPFGDLILDVDWVPGGVCKWVPGGLCKISILSSGGC